VISLKGLLSAFENRSVAAYLVYAHIIAKKVFHRNIQRIKAELFMFPQVIHSLWKKLSTFYTSNIYCGFKKSAFLKGL